MVLMVQLFAYFSQGIPYLYSTGWYGYLLERKLFLLLLLLQITGFLRLPPSCDLARVEAMKAEAELRKLSEAVNSKLATMHL
jgi:hypothetical protein